MTLRGRYWNRMETKRSWQNVAEHRPELDGNLRNIREATVSYTIRARLTPTLTHVITCDPMTSGAEDRAMSVQLMLYLQIWMSPQARAFFRQMCEQVNVSKLELKLWVRTRWVSLYDFLDCMLSHWLVSTLACITLMIIWPFLGCQPLHAGCWWQPQHPKPEEQILCGLPADDGRLEETRIDAWGSPGM